MVAWLILVHVGLAAAAALYAAFLNQRHVYEMTPRALARFQSFPDSYVLPDRASLACTVIGNAVASLMMRRIVEQLI